MSTWRFRPTFNRAHWMLRGSARSRITASNNASRLGRAETSQTKLGHKKRREHEPSPPRQIPLTMRAFAADRPASRLVRGYGCIVSSWAPKPEYVESTSRRVTTGRKQ